MVATALIISEDQKAAINDMAAGIIAGLEKAAPLFKVTPSTYWGGRPIRAKTYVSVLHAMLWVGLAAV